MAILIGLGLAIAVGLFASATQLDRDRAFYPLVTIVVASYYALFSVMAGGQALVPEVLAGAGFVIAAVLGFRGSLWLVAAALAGHGVLDLFHAHVIANPGVPRWWPDFCASYDLAAGAYLAGLLWTGRVRARRPRH